MDRRTLLKGGLAAVAVAAAPVWATAVAGPIPAATAFKAVGRTLFISVTFHPPLFAARSTAPAASAVWQQVHNRTMREAGPLRKMAWEWLDSLPSDTAT